MKIIMNFKNRKFCSLIAAALLVIGLSFLFFTHEISGSDGIITFEDDKDGQNFVESMDRQNNVLVNYFNSLYDSQVLDIKAKYSEGVISPEEMDKQLNAVIKNRELTINTLNKLSNARKDILTGNITKQDILIRINSFNDIDSDIKTELNATLNGY